jgi:hypothetical protein
VKAIGISIIEVLNYLEDVALTCAVEVAGWQGGRRSFSVERSNKVFVCKQNSRIDI